MQVKLLRVLQDGEIVRVGSITAKKTDVRILAATNKNLEKAIAEGEFRSDLYYRLKIAVPNIPPLRERRDDILPMAHVFLDFYSRKYGRKMEFSPEADSCMQAYGWPGNVRELSNEMKRAASLTPGDVVGAEDLSPRILSSEAVQTFLQKSEESEPPALVHEQLPLNLQEAEAALIRRALKEADGRKGRAAELLGITREGLRKKLQRMGEEAL